MTKFIRSLGRHRAEILDEHGNVLDQAYGRSNVHEMKERHGIKPATFDVDETHAQEQLPTGLEDDARTDLARLRAERDELREALRRILEAPNARQTNAAIYEAHAVLKRTEPKGIGTMAERLARGEYVPPSIK